MGIVAKLTKGNNILLDLNSGRYAIGQGFNLPQVMETIYTASGTSANRYDGGIAVGKRADNKPWSLSVRIMGSSNAEVQKGVQDLEWALSQAGDETEPLYFEFKPDSNVGIEPSWGQWNANKRIEIVGTEGRSLWEYYGVANVRDHAVLVNIGCQVKPYAVGKRDILATAMGGLSEYTIGQADGRSRGLCVPEATTNLITDPCVNDVAHYDITNHGTNLTKTQNLDMNYVLFETRSMKITRLASTADKNLVYIDATAANTNDHTLSCYAKKQDSSPITASDATLWYNASKATTFTAVGNGWYRLSWTGAGIAAAIHTGINIETLGVTLYVTGFQLEEKAYTTPICYGNLIGCSWTGTRHNSTSTRVVASLKLSSDILNVSEGTITLIWTPHVSYAHPNNMMLFGNGGTSLQAYYLAADDKYYFITNAQANSTAAQTFSAYTPIVFHIVWGNPGMTIYINGVSAATGANYTPPTLATDLFIGSFDATTYNIVGVINGVQIYQRAMTTAEVLADYNNMAPLVADGNQVDCMPYVWSVDGDGVLDNCDDATYHNWATAGSIPGDVEAITEWRITPSDTTTVTAYWLCKSDIPYQKFRTPTTQVNYYDFNVTSDASSNCSCDMYYDDLATTAPSETRSLTPNADIWKGRIHVFTRMAATSSISVSISPAMALASSDGSAIKGEARTIDLVASTWKLYYAGSISKVNYPAQPTELEFYPTTYLVNNSGGSAWVDWWMWIPGYVCKIGASTATGWAYFLLKGKFALVTKSGTLIERVVTTGDIIELAPNGYNMIWFITGNDSEANVKTDTGTLTSVYITPRYTLA